MRKGTLIIAAALAALFCLAGCSPKEVGKLAASEAAKLNEKTNQLSDYEVKYQLKQTIRYFSVEPATKGDTMWESLYQIDDAVLKKQTGGEFNKYKFAGKLTRQRTGDEKFSSKTTQKFEQYNDKSRMYTKLDGTVTKDEAFQDSGYSKADQLNSYYYTESDIDVIRIYELPMSSTKDYVITYRYSEDDTTAIQKMFREHGYQLSASGPYTQNYRVLQAQADIYVNKQGYIEKQFVKIRFEMTGDITYNRIKVNGTADLDVEIRYVNIGKTVKI